MANDSWGGKTHSSISVPAFFDLDLDGVQDMIYPVGQKLGVWRNNGTTLTPTPNLPLTLTPTLDLDVVQDMVYPLGQKLGVWRNNGSSDLNLPPDLPVRRHKCTT